jgi:signal transduction histidine kinase
VAWNWLNRHPRLVDWAFALLVVATAGGAAVHHGRLLVELPLALISGLALLGRRSHPLAALAVTTAATTLIVVLSGDYNPLATAVALGTVADRYERRTSLTAGAAALAVLALPLLWSVGWTNLLGFVGRLVGFAVAWLIGDGLRTRRAYIGELEEKAERLERERETEAARIAAEEQTRIARELHDVIAHNLSVIVVQAAAANDVFDRRPEQAREAVRRIEQTGRTALTELRQLLGAIRTDGVDFAPQPGLDRLDDLVRRMRDSGLEVGLTIEGTPRELATPVDVSAYRIVQEALTNTLKHAHASRADVSVSYGDSELAVEITDDGSTQGNGDGGGTGLIGMRERVAAFGGSLSAGPAPGGGFAVSARLPLPAAAT